MLLLLLRVLQGIAAGGEWGGGVLMISESAPPERRGFYASISQIGVGGGFVLSAGAFYVVQLLPEQDFHSWGWRIPFLVSIVIFGLGVYIRRSCPKARISSAPRPPARRRTCRCWMCCANIRAKC